MKTAREIVQLWWNTPDAERGWLENLIEDAITEAVIAERERNVQAVMDLCLTLREMGGEPRLIDLVKLAKRIRACTPAKGDLND